MAPQNCSKNRPFWESRASVVRVRRDPLGPDPRPKAGVFAVREAPVLYHNLRADLTGGTRKVFKPQSSYLKLISLGDKRALAERFGTARSGALLWKWKDRIDRAFMDRLSDLPVMPAPKVADAAQGVAELLAAKPLCGGCGAKVGGGVLAGAHGFSLARPAEEIWQLEQPV